MKLNHEALNLEQLSAAQTEAARLTKSSSVEPGSGTTSGGTHVTLDLTQEHPGTSYEENYRNFRRAILREERREFAAKVCRVSYPQGSAPLILKGGSLPWPGLSS